MDVVKPLYYLRYIILISSGSLAQIKKTNGAHMAPRP